MQFQGVDKVYPDWEIMSQFAVKSVLPAMTFDSFNHTHPLSRAVTNSRQIAEMFDSISYEKGEHNDTIA